MDLWLGLVFVIARVTYATAARLSQLSAWESSPALYVASGVPMMTTLDAYYSLRLARLQAAGVFVPHGPAPARHYARPEQGSPGEWYDQREPKFLPLLSRTIAAASIMAAGDIDKAGLMLPPLLSSLFMVPLFLCCWRLGAPAAGIMGGLVATFCVEYYRRTSVGWVDTDTLNLFFPWTISFLILMMSADQRRDRLLLLAAAAGAVLYVYYLWYPKPGITVLYVGAMATISSRGRVLATMRALRVGARRVRKSRSFGRLFFAASRTSSIDICWRHPRSRRRSRARFGSRQSGLPSPRPSHCIGRNATTDPAAHRSHGDRISRVRAVRAMALARDTGAGAGDVARSARVAVVAPLHSLPCALCRHRVGPHHRVS